MRSLAMLFLAAIVGALPAPAQEPRAPGTQPRVTVAVFNGARPALFIDESGTARGIFPDLLDRMLDELGFEPEFVRFESFTEAYASVRDGAVDLIPAVLRNPDRELEIDFSREAFIVSWSQVFVHSGSAIDSILALENERVALMEGDQNARAFRELMSSFELAFEELTVPDLTTANNAVRSGEAAAMVAFNYYYQGNPGLRPTSVVFAPAGGFVGTLRGTNADLMRKIDARLVELKEDPSSYYHELLANWLHYEAPAIVPMWVRTATPAAIVALLVSLATIIAYRLRVRQISVRLAQSEARFRTLFDVTGDSVIVYRLDDRNYRAISEVNDRACARLGHSREELIGTGFDRFVDDDWITSYEEINQQLTGTSPVVGRIGLRGANRAMIHFELNARRFTSQGDEYVIAVGRDIGGRLQAEEQLRESLETKNTLLREIHHRVKNNLQTISSLLNIRLMSTSDERLAQALREMADRVFAMGLLHRMLYQNDDFEAIDVQDYTQMLCRQVWSSHAPDAGRLRLDVAAERVMINLDTALPFGLMVNEAITNALKHALPDQRSGMVRVVVAQGTNGLRLE
ncbi:MAG: histidine kinase dimerization/phosphoacceptor domain -containing protein, partial [Spirochaetota bacterium]